MHASKENTAQSGAMQLHLVKMATVAQDLKECHQPACQNFKDPQLRVFTQKHGTPSPQQRQQWAQEHSDAELVAKLKANPEYLAAMGQVKDWAHLVAKAHEELQRERGQQRQQCDPRDPREAPRRWDTFPAAPTPPTDAWDLFDETQRQWGM